MAGLQLKEANIVKVSLLLFLLLLLLLLLSLSFSSFLFYSNGIIT